MSTFLSFDASRIAEGLFLGKQPIWDLSTQLQVYQAIQALVKESPWFSSICALLVSYITGHLIATISSAIGERFLVERILGYPGNNLFGAVPKNWKLFPKYSRPFSEDFRTEFSKLFKKTFGLTNPNASDRFWLSFEYVAQYCPIAFARSMHFLNLYGFNRNISFSFVFSGIFSLVFLLLRSYPLPFLMPIAMFLISIPFYWNFLKLMRRLNDEIFRAFFMHAMQYK